MGKQYCLILVLHIYLVCYYLSIFQDSFITNAISSHADVFCIKDVLKNFAKFTRKHLCQSLSFYKVAGLSLEILAQRFWYRYFPVNFAEILKNTFFIEHYWWLVLEIVVHTLERRVN